MSIEQFRKIAQPPAWALKTIGGGRLKGMTDIKPAWRIEAMTEVYGLCGVGWKYEVVDQRTESGPDGQVFAFVDVLLYIRVDGQWSDPIPGAGGNMLVEKERSGLHANDEGFKMAITDALSSAMKMLGMGHDVYAGQWTGSKYTRVVEKELPRDQQRIVDAVKESIANASDMDALSDLGVKIKNEPAAIQDAVRDAYRLRQKELKES